MPMDLIILSTRTMREYSGKVAERIALRLTNSERERVTPDSILGKTTVDRFADGEMEVTIHDSIRGKRVFLFASCAARNAIGIPVEEAKIELYHTIDALRRSQAGKITVFEPYISSSRSDRATRRNSVGLWVHEKTLVSLGTNHLITYQLHSDKSKSIVDPVLCSFEDIPATSLLKRYLCDEFVKTRDALDAEVRNQWLFCSVDAGSEKLAKKFAVAFNAQLVIAHKQRNYLKANTVDSITILSSEPISGKTVWITDDMIDSGGSVYALARELGRRDVKEINIACVHPVFSAPAVSRLRALYDEGLLRNLVVTDTVPCQKSLRDELPCLHIVSSAAMSADVIYATYANESLSRWFDPFDTLGYLSAPGLFI